MSEILDRFIVFEGLDGAGTTTQMKELAEAFDKAQIPCHATFEPTGSPIGSLVREYLRKEKVTTPLALAMLFAADREDHLHRPITGIIDQLSQHRVVVSDRYLYSSLAYQSIDCGFDVVQSLNNFPEPGFIIYLDTPVEDCLYRIDGRPNTNGRELFELQEFLNRVRDNYEVIFSQLHDSIVMLRIDGTLPKELIHAKVIELMRTHSLL